MQAIGDIISYFSPIILIVALKRAQKSDWGKIYDIFSPCVFIFSPMARGKSNHTMFNKIIGNLEKNAGNRGHNIIFSPLLF
jgi:hypothetical protein